MTKKHVKRYSTSHNQRNTNQNKIPDFAPNTGQKEGKDFMIQC